MTSDEIKRTYSMREIVERYGIKVKTDGMCSCPFHGKDAHASMKIYKDSFNCFACGANGDVFSFVQRMDNCDFKTAFISLGGDYEKFAEMARAAAMQKREHEKQLRGRKEKSEAQLRQELSDVIELSRTSIREDEPFSDRWCMSHNYFELFLLWWDEKYLNGKEVPIPIVHRVCERFRQEYHSARGSAD